MTPLTLAQIRDTINDATPDMTGALLRDLDWMIADGFEVRPKANPVYAVLEDQPDLHWDLALGTRAEQEQGR